MNLFLSPHLHLFSSSCSGLVFKSPQVLGLVSGPDGEVHYLNAPSSQGNSPAQGATMPQALQQQLITLPITMPGAKPGDAQQTVQIQVVNPNAMQQAASNSQHMQHLQNFQQGTTVLTVAYAPQDGDFLQNHGLPEVTLTFYLEELQVLNGDIL